MITKGNFGGAQRYVFDLATTLPSKNFDVVVAFGEPGLLGKKLATAGIRTIEIESLKRDVNPFLDLKSLIELIRIFRAEKPDVVHLNSSKIGGLGALAGRITRVPRIIFTAHNWAWNENRTLLSKCLIAFAHWLTVLWSHHTITVSTYNATQIARFPFIRHKIHTIHNGIDTFPTKDGFEARQLLAPSITHSTWIGTIAELHNNKGIDFLIEAFDRISHTYKDCGLIIVGGGEEQQTLQQRITEKNLRDRIHLLGYVENAKQYLKAFDIFTLTSRTEAFPYTILEAGLAELPVLASAVGGIPEIIQSGKNGILVGRGHIEEIEQGLSALLDSVNLRAHYGSELKKTVERGFSQRNMVNATAQLYN